MWSGQSYLSGLLYWNTLLTVLLIISVFIIFWTAGCTNLHHRSLESMLIPLKLCMDQLRFLCIKLGWKCLWSSCFEKVWPAGALSFLALCQDHSSAFMFPGNSSGVPGSWDPCHMPLTRGPASRSPSKHGEVGPGPWLLPLVPECLDFTACSSSWPRFSRKKSFTLLIRNFVVPLHFIFLLKNLIFSCSYLKVVI